MMPLHRRHVAGTTKDESSPSLLSPSNDGLREGRKKKARDDDHRSSLTLTNGGVLPNPSRSTVLLVLACLEVVAQITTIRKAGIRSVGHLITVVLSTVVVTLPMILTLAAGLGISGRSTKDLPHQRYIPLVVAATIFASQFPIFISYAMAAAAMVVFGLSSRPVQEDTVTEKTKGNNSDDDDDDDDDDDGDGDDGDDDGSGDDPKRPGTEDAKDVPCDETTRLLVSKN